MECKPNKICGKETVVIKAKVKEIETRKIRLINKTESGSLND